MKKIQKMLMICLMLMMCLYQPAYVSAAEKGSISITYPCEGIKVDLYEVAEQGEDSSYQLKECFTGYPVVLNQQTKEEWAGQAQALASYIKRDAVHADYSTTTNSTGNADFNDLKEGMYLAVAQTLEKDGYIYQAMPYFITIPGKSINGKPQYNVKTTAKYEKTTVTDDKTDYKVVKIWSDKNHEKIRPKSITVQLLCDGKVSQEVRLSKENNWQYTWKDLSSKNQWEVVEKKETTDYFVSISKQETSFIIQNTYWDDEYYKDTTTEKKNKKTEETKETTDKKTQTDTTEKLPQTGQLWWPLPFLAAGGILCIGIGLIKKRDNDETR